MELQEHLNWFQRSRTMGPELLTPKFLATAINADLLSFVWCFPHEWFLHLQYFSVLVNLEIWALVLDFILANCPIPPLPPRPQNGTSLRFKAVFWPPLSWVGFE